MILVLVEHEGGRPIRSSLEALTFARALGGSAEGAVAASAAAAIGTAASGSGTLEAVLFGRGATDVAGQLGAFGVGRAHVVEIPEVDDYAPAAWGRALAQLAEAGRCDAVIAAGTERGNEVMAYAGAMTGAAMAANCIEARPGNPWTVTRQRWGGSLLEEARLAGPSPRLLTVAEHVVAPEEAATAVSVEVSMYSPTLADGDLRTRVVGRVPRAPGSVALSDARVVVGGGRGVGSAGGFEPLEELATLLGGTVGVSRVVTSAGWRPHTEQVGQTGARIAPDLYIACGISGAIQHIVGCKASKAILAINTDAEAPIMARASYAVIGDLHTVLPAINDEIRRRIGSV
ncbi:MAG TPA: electron transfer flavoprotein subunit alpha/FixB family protein [Candidatus Limnocylindrales bacterium]